MSRPKKPKKTHWTCMAHVRGTAKPGCHKKAKGGPFELPKGWKIASGDGARRLLAKCPVCAG